MSHTSFRELCIRYLDDFQEACEVAWTSGATSTELATRPVVTKFLSDLALLITPSVIVHHEIQVDAKNRPDWWFSHPLNFGVYGYGDHKGLRLNGPYEMNGQERSQIERYMHLGRPVFVFDGLEFLWFTDDINNPIRVELISKPITRSQKWSSQLVNLIAYSEFQTFLDVPGFRKWNETELIQQLAVRARMMANSVESILISPLGSGRDEEENELIDATHELWKILAKHHDPNLRNRKSCADFVAQVLVFGLFFAHTRATPSGSSPSARSALISQFWTTDAVSAAGHLRPFKALVDHLTGVLAGTSDLALWTQQCMQVLAHAEFMGTESGERDFHTLFEGFLEAFDNRIRFDRGAFYTPSALTAWMTRSADHLINSIYGHTMFELAETIIDPCCGTGGFLESLIVNGERAPEVDLPTLVGFEVLPAPYALAHYRLDRVALSENYEGAIRILLTDTLSDNLHDLPDEFDSLFFQELSEANSIVQPPLRVVIGNPPSINSEASGASRREIHDMLEVFRPPKSHRGDRQNVQQAINNEAYRFLRWSAERVIEAGAGLIALVLPGSFAYSTSLKFARKWLVSNFDDIWVLMLDADGRTGSSSDSLFNVLQGRMVLFASLHPNHPQKLSVGTIGFVDISALSKDEKIEWLSTPPPSWEFEVLEVDPKNSLFIPSSPYPVNDWLNSWPLRETRNGVGIFQKKCSGMKAAPARLLIHTDIPILRRRGLAVGASSDEEFTHTYEELKTLWWAGQRRPPGERKFTPDVRSACRSGFSSTDSIRRLSFRPFVDAYICDDSDLIAALGRAPGDGTRFRPELETAFNQGAVAIALAPSTMDIGETLTRFCSFVWNLPDNDLVSRQNAMIHPNVYPSSSKELVVSNFSTEIKNSFSNQSTDEIIYYCYAVLSCQSYLDFFEGALFVPSDPDSPPRIPIAADRSTRESLAELGRAIAECEKPGHIPDSDLSKDLKVSWEHAEREFRLKRADIDSHREHIILYDANGPRVTIGGVCEKILDLVISGYPVVSTWLRERQYPYLRRAFRESDLKELVTLLESVSEQQERLREVEKIVEGLLYSGNFLPPPS